MSKRSTETKQTRPRAGQKSSARSGKGRRGAGSERKSAPPADSSAARTVTRQVAARASLAVQDPSPNRAGKYVYCVVRSDKPGEFGLIGIGADPSRVSTVHYKDLAAVVSETPIGVQDPTRENVLAHQRVNETVMRNHTVLPMSFGTVFKTDQDIVELLRSAYDAFVDVLVKMEGKLEFGLKVLWDRDQVVQKLEHDDEDILRLKTEISLRTGSTYFARMQYGRMIDAALQKQSESYVAEIFEALRDVSVAARSNKPIGDKMIMNAAFLVSREQEAAFDAKVKQLGTRYSDVTFKYTGPWPPYNFVNIRLKLERAE